MHLLKDVHLDKLHMLMARRKEFNSVKCGTIKPVQTVFTANTVISTVNFNAVDWMQVEMVFRENIFRVSDKGRLGCSNEGSSEIDPKTGRTRTCDSTADCGPKHQCELSSTLKRKICCRPLVKGFYFHLFSKILNIFS